MKLVSCIPAPTFTNETLCEGSFTSCPGPCVPHRKGHRGAAGTNKKTASGMAQKGNREGSRLTYCLGDEAPPASKCGERIRTSNPPPSDSDGGESNFTFGRGAIALSNFTLGRGAIGFSLDTHV